MRRLLIPFVLSFVALALNQSELSASTTALFPQGTSTFTTGQSVAVAFSHVLSFAPQNAYSVRASGGGRTEKVSIDLQGQGSIFDVEKQSSGWYVLSVHTAMENVVLPRSNATVSSGFVVSGSASSPSGSLQVELFNQHWQRIVRVVGVPAGSSKPARFSTSLRYRSSNNQNGYLVVATCDATGVVFSASVLPVHLLKNVG